MLAVGNLVLLILIYLCCEILGQILLKMGLVIRIFRALRLRSFVVGGRRKVIGLARVYDLSPRGGLIEVFLDRHLLLPIGPADSLKLYEALGHPVRVRGEQGAAMAVYHDREAGLFLGASDSRRGDGAAVGY